MKISFAEYTQQGHGGVMPSDEYLRAAAAIIGEYCLRGTAALDHRATDEICSYCLDVIGSMGRAPIHKYPSLL